MRKKIAKDIQHYLPLAGLFLLGFFAFLYFSYDQTFQAAVAISVAVAYVVWGIVHHAIHRDLDLSVVIEYIIVACLGLVIVFSLLFEI
jgi:hypothetical protein